MNDNYLTLVIVLEKSKITIQINQIRLGKSKPFTKAYVCIKLVEAK